MKFDAAGRIRNINRRAAMLAILNMLMWAVVILWLAWVRF